MTFFRYWMLLFIMPFFISACHNTNGSAGKGELVSDDSITNNRNNEDSLNTKYYQTIQPFWADFQQAIRENNSNALIKLTHFPLPGVTPFIESDGSTASQDTDTAQFLSALPDILARAPREQILRTNADSLVTISKEDLTQQISGSEPILQNLDMDSQIYLCYAQWSDDSDKETNQTFIFAKKNGSYKLCGIAWRGGIY
ncbi:hypothetical protein [Chitinophaga japonensis]|uniref:Uncharacterized protein n=1 Tax=Chitinophaga japonensis TaxID=104662 RepID=A0A562T529_CHIJA|nr:hypothetical protein [Chitinophaga japonensis]TWI88647.1 hypothetical protein LX66_2733 [Chitinophaga japonensis]